MPDFLIPKSPLVSGLVALVFAAGNWITARHIKLTDESND